MPILERDGVRIDYREAGAGEAVILIHGGASSNGQWRSLMEALAPRFRAIAYNLYGCGGTSPWPPGRAQTLADQARLALAMADYAGGPVHLVGHSYGGTVALKAALSLAPRLESLVLLEPNPFALLREHGRAESYAEVCEVRDFLKLRGAAGDWEGVAERFVDYWNAPGSWAAMPPDRKHAILASLPGTLPGLDPLMETMPCSDFVPLAARTLVVVSRDTVRPIREIAEVLKEQVPGMQWEELPAGGHMAPLTRPDLVNPIVCRFLERAARPA